LVFVLFSCKQDKGIIYKDKNAPIDERVEDLLLRMTLEDKFWQLYMIPGDLLEGKEKYKHGIFGFQIATKPGSGGEAGQVLDYSAGGTAQETAELINKTQKYFMGETRLGIPIIPFDEALHGLIRKGATAFPQAIALAASWDTLLMGKVSEAIALEVKSRGIRQVLSPVVNIARDVRWGRVEETYGEDPFLTTQMALEYVSNFQKNGIVATPKHFVANVGDGGRDSYPIHFNERLLEEFYFPAFKACVQDAGALSVMTAYNSLNGTPCSSNNWLLNHKLKDQWGFKGFVISDAGATGGANVLHNTSLTYAESTKQAIEGGLDVIFQTSYDHYPLFYKAFKNGTIKQGAIDSAVRRVLHAKFGLGLFENPYVETNDVEQAELLKKHRKLAKEAALKSIVLLKNKQHVLPLSKQIKSLAVIGPDATEARLGGYSGPGNNSVSVLDGIKNKLPHSCKISYAVGCGRETGDFVGIPTENLYFMENNKKVNGLRGDYYNNVNLDGQPLFCRNDKQVNFRWTLFSPDPDRLDYDNYSVRWTGRLKATETGFFQIGIKGDDGYRLYLDNKLIIDNWRKQTVQQITEGFFFEKGKDYDIKIEFYETRGNVWFKLIWDMGVKNQWQRQIEEALDISRKSDAAIVVVGINEGEFRDRAGLNLPGHQEEMIRAIAQTGKPTIVVLVGGSAITMENWRRQVTAIIDMWYGGDEGGNALADVVFGDYCPAGRLPITFPVDVAQCPLYYNHKASGRGDDYQDMTGKPLYPFGYGLSYTQFEYSNIRIEDPEILPNQKTKISFTIKNTGMYDGDEVVQLYIKDVYASLARPIIELKGFQRVQLKKGEGKSLSFEITPKLLEMPDKDLKPVVEPGEFLLMIGSSSNDIRLKTVLNVK